MIDSREQDADRIREQLECPRCEYSLRGLPGDQVICPECGQPCDIAQMIARNWTLPWTRAPAYSQLITPVAWAMGGGLAALVALILAMARDATPLPCMLVVTGTWVVWLNRLGQIHATLGGEHAVVLSLLAHALAAGYVIAAGSVIAAVVMLCSSPGMETLSLALVLVVAGVGGCILCRRGERRIAEDCIRRWLRTGGAATTMHA